MAHKFVVGQTVGLARTILRQAAAEEYDWPTHAHDCRRPRKSLLSRQEHWRES